MARLKRQPKRGGSAHPGIASFIAQLSTAEPHDLPALVDPLVREGWSWPRTDLQHWIVPLNRFDEILEQTITDYDLAGMEHAQTNSFTPRTKHLVLSVLAFEKLLLENSTNRKIFNGFDRLNDLLHTTDLDVLLATLRLALRPAQQYSSVNSSLSSIPFSERRLLNLAQPWGTREHGIEMVDLAQDKPLEVPLELQEPEWQFYRKVDKAAQPASASADKDKDEMEVEGAAQPQADASTSAASVSTPAPARRTSYFAAPAQQTPGGQAPTTPGQPQVPQTPATPAPASTSAGATKPQEGMTTVHLPNFRLNSDKSVIDALLDLVATHQVPERDRLELLQKLRISHALCASADGGASERQQLLVVRLLALAVYAHAQPEQNAQLKVFLYEPELIPQLAELVHHDRDIPIEIKSAALYALEAFARYKGKTAEVASALNASVSHGVLMELVRKLAADLDTDSPSATTEFVDALFNLLTYINMHQTVGLMVIGAGLIPVLLDFVKDTRRGPLQMIAANKAVVLLDGFLYGYTNAFTAYMSASGLNTFIERIKSEVDLAIEEHDAEAQKLEPSVKEATTGLLEFQPATLLKNILRALQRLMTTAGTTEGLRNIVDTPLLGAVKKVMEHRRVFGPQVFSLITNIAATFVHNEPTSLATLQEHKVPDAFYDSLVQGIPASNDVLQAIPNAVGAFCLNAAGLTQFTERNLVPKYFAIFTSPDHFELLRDRDSAVVIGSAIDELVRHHPTLRETVMGAIMRVFEDLKAWGDKFVPPEGEQGYALVAAPADKGKASAEGGADVHMQEGEGAQASTTTTAAAPATAAAAQDDKEKKDDKEKRKEEELKDNEVTNAIDVFGRFLEGLFQNLGHTTDFLGNSTRAFELVLDLLELPCCPAIMVKNSGYSSIVAIFRIASEIKAPESLAAVLGRTNKWLEQTRWFWDVSRDNVARESTLGAMVNPSAAELAEQQARFRAVTILLSHISLLSDIFINLTYVHGKAATAVLGVFGSQAPREQQDLLEKIGAVYRACQWENVTIRPTSFWTGEASKSAAEQAAQKADEQGEAPTPAVAAAREHQQEQAAEKAAVEAISTPATPDSPNIKLVQDVIQTFTKMTLPLFQSIIKLFMHRRSTEPGHRKVAKEVADKVARFIRDGLVWPDAKDLPAKLAYAAQSFVLVTKVLFDERPNLTGLQTHLLRSFVAVGGLDAYLELFNRLQDVANDWFSSEDASSASPLIIPVFGGIKTALEFLSRLTSQKVLLEATQTALLATREKNPASPDYFDAPAFLVRIRAAALPSLRTAWDQPWLRKCPQNVVRSLVATLINILKAEGEQSTEPAARTDRSLGQVLGDGGLGGGLGGALNALNAVLGGGVGGILGGAGPAGIATPPTPAAPDETRVSQLMDMGFPRTACETALRRCRNNVALATEYLLQHPDLVGAARDEELRAPAPAPAAAAAAEAPAPADPTDAQAEAGPAPTAEVVPAAPDAAPEQPADAPVAVAEVPAQPVDVEMGEASTSTAQEQPADEAAAPAAEEPQGPPLDELKKTLEETRKEIKPDFVNRALELAEEYGDLVFDIKSVFALFGSPEGETASAPLKSLLADLASRLEGSTEEVAKSEAAAAARFRLIALITTDPAYRESVEPNREELMAATIRCQKLYSAQPPAKDARPKWLAPLMLVSDSLLSIQNVPKPTTILAEGEEVPSVELVAQGPAWNDERAALFDLAMDVLEKGVSTRELFISTLRLLLILTRDHDLAAKFVERDGLKLIFSAFASESPETKGCHSYAVMILRHIVEEKSVLRPMMEREIELWFGNSRSKVADITGFIRGASSVAFRDMPTFLEAAKSTVKLVSADAAHHYHVTLIKDPSSAAHKTVDAEPLKSPLNQQEGGEAHDVAMIESGGAPSKPQKTVTPASATVESTVHFLMQQVLDTHKAALAPIPVPAAAATEEPTGPAASGATDSPAPSAAAATSAATADAGKKDSKDAHIPADVPLGDFYQSAFSLACLAELVASYNPCKSGFLTFSTRKGASKEAVAARSRSSFLYFLLNDLVPSTTLVPSLDFDSKRISSMWGWASLVIVGLCYDATAASLGSGSSDKDSVNDITNVRKAVLDAIARAYRDAMASNEPTEHRYARLACLSDLCHRLLTARPFPHAGRPHSETSMQLAKLMLERNFAVILTNALAEVDLNFPHVNSLINAILRPLENLTKVVTKLGRAKNAPATGGRKRLFSEDISTDASSMDDSDDSLDSVSEAEQDQAAADLYRNSALGMYEGELETGAGAGDEYMSEDQEDFDDDDEMMEDMEDGFGSGSDISDASDLDEDDDGEEHGFDDEEMEELEGAGEDDDELSTDGSHADHLDEDDIAEEFEVEGGSEADEQDILEAFDGELDGEEADWVDEDEDDVPIDAGGVIAGGQNDLVFDGEDGDDLGDEADIDQGGVSDGEFTDEEEVLTGELEFDPEMTEQLRAQSTAQAYGWDPVTGGEGSSGRRNRALADEMMQLGDAGMFDRPRHTNTAAPHPLLVEGPSPEAQAAAAARRPRGNNATSRDSPAYQEWVRSIEQMLGPGGVNTLQEVLGSHGLSHLSGPDQLRIQLAPGPDGGMAVVIDPTPGIRATQQQAAHALHHGPEPTRTSSSSRSVARQLSDRINAASAFLPVQTNQRWQEEGRILQGCVLIAERVARMTNHLINVLHAPARVEAKEARAKAEELRKKEEAAEREAEEKRRKDEEEKAKKDKEERVKREAQEKQKKEEEEAEAERQRREAAAAQQQSTAAATSASMDVDAAAGEDLPDDVAEVMNLARSLAAGLAVPSTSGSTPARQPTPSTSTPAAASSAAEAAPVASTSASDAMQAESSNAAAARERVTVLVHGEEVDITDTGIDREFLEALPDDMRDEVIRQHLRESRIRSNGPPPAVPEHINSEFLDALPPDLRAEVLRQEAAEQRRQAAASAGGAPADEPADAVDMDPASFLATLDPALRSAVLSEEGEELAGGVPSGVLGGPGIGGADGNPLARLLGRAAPSAGVPIARGGPRGAQAGLARATGGEAAGAAAAGPKKPTPQREVIQLLDKSGLATLVRLLFFPQPLRKNTLQRVLVNLCENARTRVELINLLLTILQDGTRDVSAVDKSFSQMSIRASRAVAPKDTPKRKTPDTPGGALPHFPGESVPNLIAQRCLEALLFLAANDQTPLFFLTEQEVHVSKRHSKKGKGKEKAQPTTIYPVIVLLSLLERPAMLKTPAMMDAVTSLLAQVTRLLQSLPKQPVKAEGEPGATAAVPAGSAPAVAAAAADEVASGASEEAVKPKDKGKDKDKDEKEPDSPTEILTKAPPHIPASNLRLIVNVLDAGECSSRTFSQTLTIIQNLSHLENARETILDELKQRAEKISNEIAPDLVELLDTINRDQPVPGSTLARFTPASSSQAKLLRILKTIDFFGTPKKSPTQSSGEPASKTLSPEEEQVKSIYTSLSVSDLWKRLSDALGGIEAKPDLLYLSTVLLPLIESLLVVNKFTDASSTEFIDFTTAHSKILNTMVRNNPSLMSGSFAVLVRNSTMLDFENKRSFFFSRLHDRAQRQRQHYPSINLNVRRDRVFEDSYFVFRSKSGDQIKNGKLNVKFYDEEGVDAGGVTREWFSVLARQIFNPGYALFQPQAADSLTYQPNKLSYYNKDHLLYFHFVGRIIGKAIHDQRILEAYFSRSMYKHMLGKPVDHRDLESIDPEYYKSLVWMLENDIEDIIDLTFSVERDEFGKIETVDLIPDGRNIAVTNENKHDYVRRIADQRLSIDIKQQMDALLRGLYEIVPKDLLQIFSERELELLISGLPTIDADEWRSHTDLVGYRPSDPIVGYFWRAVRSFSHEERAKLLQFVSGSSRVPLEGFGALQGMSGVTKFNIHKAAHNASLPQAHTCFNQLDLPSGYDSYEQLRRQLLIAITEGATGFAFQ
ncbi:E3 ubiquitin-protein ligase TOM1 [Rhodotorula paludigena]|uniref:E3 ubiquitin-protein ligase TOM1 n=1 Tax=Rhodotorula paludigena TaxID=86838 RepID=UPI00317CC701